MTLLVSTRVGGKVVLVPRLVRVEVRGVEVELMIERGRVAVRVTVKVMVEVGGV